MRADAGEVWLDGERIDRMTPWRRAYAGIGRTFQITRVFADMTVLENVVAPLRSFSWRQLRAGAVSGEEATRADELLEFVGMAEYRDQPRRGALVRTAQAGRARPGADARPEADPARRAGRRDQPDPDRADRGDDPRAQRARARPSSSSSTTCRWCSASATRSSCSPAARASAPGAPDEIQRDPRVLDAYLGDDFQLEEPAVASDVTSMLELRGRRRRLRRR